jgi:hypothetical protein
VRFIHQSLGDLALDTGQTDVEPSAEDVTVIGERQVLVGVNSQAGRQLDFVLARGKRKGTFSLLKQGDQRRSAFGDVDDGLGKSLRRLLRQIVSDAPGNQPVRVLA